MSFTLNKSTVFARRILSAFVMFAAIFAYGDVKVMQAMGRAGNKYEAVQSEIGVISFAKQLLWSNENLDLIRLSENPLSALSLENVARLRGESYNSENSIYPIRKIIDRVTRRSAVNSLILLNAANQARNLPLLVTTFDRLISVRQDIRGIAYLQLAQVLELPGGRRLIAERSERTWFPYFISVVAGDPKLSVQLFPLFEEIRLKKVKNPQEIERIIINQLVKSEQISLAQKFSIRYDEMHPKDWNSLEWSSGNNLIDRSPLAWSLLAAETRIDQTKNSSLLIHLERIGSRTTIAQKYLVISPGVYYLRANVKYGLDANAGDLVWSVKCGSIKIPQSFKAISQGSSVTGRAIELKFQALSECTSYQIRLFWRGSLESNAPQDVSVASPQLRLM